MATIDTSQVVTWEVDPEDDRGFDVLTPLDVVNSDDDFQRVVIGMNGGRPSLTADSDYVALLPADLSAAGVAAEPCPGETLCRLTNALHHDIQRTGRFIRNDDGWVQRDCHSDTDALFHAAA